MSNQQSSTKFDTFHILAQFPFTTSESELDYHHEKVNLRVASRIAERLKTTDFRKFQENLSKAWDC